MQIDTTTPTGQTGKKMKFRINPIILTDAYKISHPGQYPDKTEYVYSNTTARASRFKEVTKVVVFGLQYFIKKYLMEDFEHNFFNRPRGLVIQELQEFFDEYFGPGSVDAEKRYGPLHDLGYLPLKIKALPEGTRCPIGVPYNTIINTHPDFGWLTNAIETLNQNTCWNPLVAATIADQYKKLLNKYADKTVGNRDHVKFQAHNFSMRGMSSLESSMTTDAGHLLSFVGSDTLPGNMFLKHYYNADPTEAMISCSVPATEHAVMCAGQQQDERKTIRRIIKDVHPNGIVSVVSDTWDLWKVLTEIAPSLREEIESRDGKVVFRPDSGDPVKILCGYKVVEFPIDKDTLVNDKLHSQSWWFKNMTDQDADCIKTSDGYYVDLDGKVLTENQVKGAVKILDEHFGSTVNIKGFRELNPKVGLIYGDSITLERCEKICKELTDKGYATSNVVFGVGSYTYQYNTRDTFYVACKATWVQIDGVGYNISKNPVTDSGKKRSACGLLRVDRYVGAHGSVLVLRDQVTPEEEAGGELVTVYEDGKLLVDETLEGIRKRLACGVDYPV